MPRKRTKKYDVVIIGGGFIGATLAKKLGDLGKSVLILEAGVANGLIPGGYQSYVDHFYTNSIKGPPNAPYPQNKFAPMPGKPDQPYWINRGPIDYGSDYTRALGGTSLHWLGVSLRHVPNDFHTANKYQRGRNWPISYDELAPYYRQAEHFIGVSGDVADQSYLGVKFEPGYQYPMKTVPLSWLNRQMKQAVDGMTVSYGGESYPIDVVPLPQARNSVPYKPHYEPIGNGAPYRYGEGQRCEGNSACIPICPVQAKYTALRTLYQTSIKHVTIQTQSVASEILLDSAGRVDGIVYKQYHDPNGPFDSGNVQTHTVKAKIYVIGAHAVETAKLCLGSKNGGKNAPWCCKRQRNDGPTPDGSSLLELHRDVPQACRAVSWSGCHRRNPDAPGRAFST